MRASVLTRQVCQGTNNKTEDEASMKIAPAVLLLLKINTGSLLAGAPHPQMRSGPATDTHAGPLSWKQKMKQQNCSCCQCAVTSSLLAGAPHPQMRSGLATDTHAGPLSWKQKMKHQN